MSQGGGPPISGFGAVPGLTIEDLKTIEGITFQIRKRLSVPHSDSIDIVIDPTAFTKEDLVSQPIGFDAVGGPLEVDIYIGVTANDDGTDIPIYNKNFTSDNVSELTAKLDPTGVSLVGATGPLELEIPSNGVGAANVSGATGNDSIISVLDPTKKILIRISNTDTTNTAVVGLKSDHFEVPQA
jgi:hypothetical protein